MLWVKAFHIIAMVAWFAGLFYLPRLFVYHADTTDSISDERFKTMEWRLYYAITMPAGIITTVLGFWLLSFAWSAYMHAGWLHAKLSLVALLWIFHIYCGAIVSRFQRNQNCHSQKFYRIFNEIPTLLLISIVILVVVKPF